MHDTQFVKDMLIAELIWNQLEVSHERDVQLCIKMSDGFESFHAKFAGDVLEVFFLMGCAFSEEWGRGS